MSVVLGGIENFAMTYLDDILVFSETPEHFAHLKQVLGQSRRCGLKLKLSKCQFFRTETKYLGFIISEGGIKPILDKVKVLREMPEPKTVRQVR